MNLPTSIDKTPSGTLVERATIGTHGYMVNIEYQLTMTILNNELNIEYYGEDGTYLDKDEIFSIIKKYNLDI